MSHHKISKTRPSIPAPSFAPAQPMLTDLREMIAQARKSVARTIDSGLTLLYWQIGERIRLEILKEQRAEYGANILQTLSAKLQLEFGNGFAEKNLRRMVQLQQRFCGRWIRSFWSWE